MKSSTIYYFSGTGNSWQAAKKLKEILPKSDLAPIVASMNKKEIQPPSQVIGFVFPIHLSTIPIFILEFIKQLDLSGVEYIFAVASRVGTQHSAFHELEKVLKKRGKKLNAFVSLNMPSNDPKFGFKELPLEQVKIQENAWLEKIKLLAEAIKVTQDLRRPDDAFTTKVPLVNSLAWLVKLTDKIQQNFYADEKCNGCGTCAQVCPSSKIVMVNGRPEWKKKVQCFKCHACLNFCPQKAVQIKGYTEKKGRYHHPYATADDIAQQKL